MIPINSQADFIAHIRTDENAKHIIQGSVEHCRNVASYASKLLSFIGLKNVAYLSGLIHDMGKFTEKFNSYITDSSNGIDVRRGSVNHTFAAVIYLFERYHKHTFASYRDVTCEIIAYAAGAHHGQFDCFDSDGNDGFLHRINKDRSEICYEEAVGNYLSHCADEKEIDSLFDSATAEIEALSNVCKNSVSNKQNSEYAFVYSLLCRLVLSAVIDADRQDTAEFMCSFEFPDYPDDMRRIWLRELNYAEGLISEFTADSAINISRSKISDTCKTFASRESGIFRLSVPTGSGKTLSSLRYALAHSAAHNKKRIFFIIPLLSVTEQNAEIIRKYISDQSMILEHHSNVVIEPDGSEKLNKNELFCENWHSILIISTMAQFLNTLFLGKPSSARRMASLCNSVIIIDEVQSVPTKLLSLFNIAINFLSIVCGATVVLCSATQPCFEKSEHPLKLNSDCNIVTYDKAIWQPFHRTEVVDKRICGGYSVQELAEFALDIKSKTQSLLIICNTKSEAKQLFSELSGCGCRLFHLSNSMCVQHRLDKLHDIIDCLSSGEPIICVATQLVEAGIDFSFEAVIRVSAGIDNVAQAAGRCNRSGDFGHICNVYIVNFKDEKLSRLKEIQQAQTAAEELLAAYSEDSTRFDDALLSDKSVEYYYRRLFGSMRPSSQDFILPDLGTSIFDMLAQNRQFADRYKGENFLHFLCQAFKTAGKRFEVFDDNTIDVIVPYNRHANEIIADLYSSRAERSTEYKKQKLDEAKKYSVSLYSYQLEALEKNGGACGDSEMFKSVLSGFYDLEIGITPDGAKNWSSGGCI